jgi:transposase
VAGDQARGDLAGVRCCGLGLLEGQSDVVVAPARVLQRAAELRQLGEPEKRCKRHESVRLVGYQQLVADIHAESAELDKRIEALNDELAEVARRDESARRLATIPGVGVINATALVAAIGDGSAFAKGRDLSARLGLVPRQHTTGGKTKLLGISKRGNQYLRRQLIHVRDPCCSGSRRRKHPWDTGSTRCLGASTLMSLWSPWAANLPGSPGHCCAIVPTSIDAPSPAPDLHRRAVGGSRSPVRSAGGAEQMA